ncbi:hypothetical protein GI582_04725 [Sulfitobacter sp. BDSS02]|nr:hypothetical protein [Sulfitobacter sp. BDSS02]MBR9848350.1 sulfotransferase [Paracoccaceae bacterium]
MIGPVLVCLVAVVGFGLGIWKTRLVASSQGVFAAISAGIAAMFDPALSDEEKEASIRRTGLDLIKKTGGLALRLILSLLAAAVPIYLADWLGLVPLEASMDMMLSWEFIVIVSVVAIAVGSILSRLLGGKKEAEPSEGYSAGDQMVHTLAFASPGLMRRLAASDDSLFSGKVAGVKPAGPIFITSLARGGTTALLNALHDLPNVATHRYADMPFLTAPLLWSKLGGNRSVARRERAHGDGMEIDLESPEAFDEVLWRLYWPEKYNGNKIALWRPGDIKEKARDVMRRHMSKIILLRKGDKAAGGDVHYVSKNNANIARLTVIPEMFPGAEVIVPLRHPVTHAASLLRQHKNFLTRHAEDPFSRRYMNDIGHLEFGELMRPIAFEGFAPGGRESTSPDYWLAYWIAAFREIRQNGEGCHLVAQDDLRSNPQGTMDALCDRIGLDHGGVDFTKYFRPGADLGDSSVYSSELLAEAQALYEELNARAVRASVAVEA